MYRSAPRFVRTVGFALPLALMLAACDQLPASPSSTAPPDSQSATIQLSGSVTDAAWRPLAGARVEVVEGPQAGVSTTTDANGDYFLQGARRRHSFSGDQGRSRPIHVPTASCLRAMQSPLVDYFHWRHWRRNPISRVTTASR